MADPAMMITENQSESERIEAILDCRQKHGDVEQSKQGQYDSAVAFIEENTAELKLALATFRHIRGRRHFKTRDLAAEFDTTANALKHVMPQLEARGWISEWSDAHETTWRVEL